MVSNQQVQPVKLYFAYGSNLSLAQMRERCPGSVPVAAYVLPDYRLGFVGERTQRWGIGGVATIVPQPGSSVQGALYRLTEADEARLDVFEGVNPAKPELGSYYKEEALITYHDERALVYIATAQLCEKGEFAPSTAYCSVIEQGRRDWGLPGLTQVG